MQTIDPVNNKKQIKESITNAIAKLVTGSNRDEIALGLKKHMRDFLNIRETSYWRGRFLRMSHFLLRGFLRMSHRLQRARLDEK